MNVFKKKALNRICQVALLFLTTVSLCAQTPKSDSMEVAVRDLRYYIEKHGVSITLTPKNPEPEFFLILCYLDSAGQMDDIKLFRADSSSQGNYYQDEVVPGVKKTWKPKKYPYSGIIIPVFIFPGSIEGIRRQRHIDFNNFFISLWRQRCRSSNMYLAKEVSIYTSY